MSRLPTPRVPRFLLPIAMPLLAVSMPAAAQTTVIQAENVRMDYAQVMRVEPVYQTLRATSMEQYCNGKPVKPESERERGLSRFVGAVKDVLVPQSDEPATTSPVLAEGCSMVPVVREYRRPIAYDVDYVYKGSKYRSRLPNDPGNRLRVRVSVTPQVPVPGDR